jgi:hypothetical protein
MFVLYEGIKDKQEMMWEPPYGPGFTKDEIANAETMDIVASDIKEPGIDYAIFMLRNKTGEVIQSKKIIGY